MPYAITQSCCTDASCVSACPVNCIHPAPGEPDFGSTDMLYVDPRSCIDCGVCAEVCPVDAVFPVETLTGPLAGYAEINAAYFTDLTDPEGAGEAADPSGPGEPVAGSPLFHPWDPVRFDRVLPAGFPQLEVAVVGSGPAGMYAVEDLLLHTTARVTIIDRLAVAGGLVRFGVAPDHAATKRIGETFARHHSHHRVRMRLGVEVGRDVTVDDLADEFDAVVYAVGASASRDLGVPGAELPGNLASTAVVGWYNGHPEIAPDAVDLGGERSDGAGHAGERSDGAGHAGERSDGRGPGTGRVVVVGTGNVALDVARLVSSDPEALEQCGVGAPVVAAVRSGDVREVVVLGRRGPEDASWTRGELLGLLRRDDLDVVVDDHDPRTGAAIDAAGPADTAGLLRGLPQTSTTPSPSPSPSPSGARRRVVLRFHSAPERVLGEDRVTGIRVGGVDGPVDLSTGLVVRAIGHRGRPVSGLPFDEATGTVPHTGGRVGGRTGTYVVGWIKRGASGGIGANRADAAETVGSLLADGAEGVLGTGTPRGVAGSVRRVARAVRERL